MSVITDMVLIVPMSSRQSEAVDRLNAWCLEHDKRQQVFRRLDQGDSSVAGGTKWFFTGVYAMAGNHFPWWDLKEAFTKGEFGFDKGSLLWIEPEGASAYAVWAMLGSVEEV